jgi:hypothetical protein
MKLNSSTNEHSAIGSAPRYLKHGIISALTAAIPLTPLITSSRDLLVASLLQAT